MFNSPTYKWLNKWTVAVLDNFILKIILLQHWGYVPVNAWHSTADVSCLLVATCRHRGHCRNLPFHPACAPAVERSSSLWDWVIFPTLCNKLHYRCQQPMSRMVALLSADNMMLDVLPAWRSCVQLVWCVHWCSRQIERLNLLCLMSLLMIVRVFWRL